MLSLRFKKIYFVIAMIITIASKLIAIGTTEYMLNAYPTLFAEANPVALFLMQFGTPIMAIILISLTIGFSVVIYYQFIPYNPESKELETILNDFGFITIMTLFTLMSLFDMFHDLVLYYSML